MAYIGKEPIVGNFQKCDAITVVNGQAAYTLQVSSTNVVPESANHMLVSLNGILQAPVTSFTVSGATLTFVSNLATGDVIDFVMLLGNVLDIGTPSDDTVTLAKMASGTDGNIISYDASGNPVAIATGSDGQVLTSAGAGQPPAFETASGGDNTPNFFAYVSADTTVSDGTLTLVNANTELWDSDNAYTNTASNYKFTVPSGKAGKYSFTLGYEMFHTSTGIFYWSGRFYKNGSRFIEKSEQISPNDYTNVADLITVEMDLSVSDYIQAYTFVDNANNTSMSLKGGTAPIRTWFSGFKLL